VIQNVNILMQNPGRAHPDFPAGTAVTLNKPARAHYPSPGVIRPLDDPLFDAARRQKGLLVSISVL